MPIPPGVADPTTVFGTSGQPLTIPTPDGTGQVTHPDVIELPTRPFGYRYIMAGTPYERSDDAKEDPCVWHSVDGVVWVALAANPIVDYPGTVGGAYGSDVDLQLIDGVIYLIWRVVDTVALVETLLYATSLDDGVTWSAATPFYSVSQSVYRLVSPCMHWDGVQWRMWAVNINPPTHEIVLLTGGETLNDTWSAPVACTAALPAGREAWHLGVEAVSGGFVALITDIPNGSTGGNGTLIFAASTDGLIWETGTSTCIPQVEPTIYDALYRACLIPENRDGVDGWLVWFSRWIQSTATWGVSLTWIGPPAPETPTTPAPTAVAAVDVDWFACDLVSGAKIARLPMMIGNPRWELSAYSSVDPQLPLPTAGPGRIIGLPYPILRPTTTMYVCVVNGVPAWGGILLKPQGGTDPITTPSLVSLEGYFLRRYVGDHDLIEQDEAVIFKTLVGDANNSEGIGLVVDAPTTGVRHTRHYYDTEDVTVYQRLQELSGIQGGPEWKIDLEWTDERMTHVRKVARLRPRFGRAVPAVTLSSNGEAYVTYDWTEDWSEGRGANDVMAYSSGQGTVRPQSDRMRNEAALAAGQPRFEHRFQPSSSITSKDVLNSHARQKLDEIGNGTVFVNLTCRSNVSPARFGVDWEIGDELLLDLWGHLDPYGRLAQGRAVAAELDPVKGEITPAILLREW